MDTGTYLCDMLLGQCSVVLILFLRIVKHLDMLYSQASKSLLYSFLSSS